MNEVPITFVQACLNGTAKSSEIDSYVDRWHGTTDNRSLYAYLGLTEDEYRTWLRDPSFIDSVIADRKRITK